MGPEIGLIVDRDLLQCVIGPASHAFKREMAMNGRNRILSARLGEDIIDTSSPGERSALGQC